MIKQCILILIGHLSFTKQMILKGWGYANVIHFQCMSVVQSGLIIFVLIFIFNQIKIHTTLQFDSINFCFIEITIIFFTLEFVVCKFVFFQQDIKGP